METETQAIKIDWLTTSHTCSDKCLTCWTNFRSSTNNLLSKPYPSAIHNLPLIFTGSRHRKKARILILMLTGRGLATPIWTLPSTAPFKAWTASSRLAFSRLVALTYMSRSPGSSLPSCSATPLGTRERITITVLAGSSGSYDRDGPGRWEEVSR